MANEGLELPIKVCNTDETNPKNNNYHGVFFVCALFRVLFFFSERCINVLDFINVSAKKKMRACRFALHLPV